MIPEMRKVDFHSWLDYDEIAMVVFESSYRIEQDDMVEFETDEFVYEAQVLNTHNPESELLSELDIEIGNGKVAGGVAVMTKQEDKKNNTDDIFLL